MCIKSGADALANLPSLGKVVPARGCGHFGNATGPRVIVSPPRETGGRFFMSKRKSGDHGAELASPPERVCILVVDAIIDEIEVEIWCQRTDGVDRVFSTSMDWLHAERPSEYAAPDAVLARPLSLASYPVATGRHPMSDQGPLSQLLRSGRGEADPVPESVAAAASNRKSLKRNRRRRRRSHTSILRRARFFGTHAPRDKENQPEMPERKNAGAPRCCFAATPLVGELPRSNGQTTAWPSAPSRALWVRKRVNAAPQPAVAIGAWRS